MLGYYRTVIPVTFRQIWDKYLCTDKYQNEGKWMFGMYDPIPPHPYHHFVVWTSGLQAFVGMSAPLRREQMWDATETGGNCDWVELLSAEIQAHGGAEALLSHQAKGKGAAVQGQVVKAAVMVGDEPSVINEDVKPRLCLKSVAWNLVRFKSGEFFCFDPTTSSQDSLSAAPESLMLHNWLIFMNNTKGQVSTMITVFMHYPMG